jgi:hypothetical protein
MLGGFSPLLFPAHKLAHISGKLQPEKWLKSWTLTAIGLILCSPA